MAPSSSSDIPPPATDANGSKIEMRPYYGQKDLNYVHYLVYSTSFDLVPKGVRRLLTSPLVISSWLAVFAALYVLIPQQLASYGWPNELMLAVKIAVVIASTGGGLLGLSWYVDRYVVGNPVYAALANDLRDPGEYYRKDDGNFWLLTVQGQPVACIGMDHHQTTVMEAAPGPANMANSQEIQQADWPKVAAFLARIDDTMRNFLAKKPAPKVFFKAHKPNEASVRRLHVKSNLQDQGLSTPLLKRVAFWAHSHQVEYLFAETNELQGKLAEILRKRHGYELVSTTKTGFFGKTKLWRLDVKLWMSKEIEARDQQKLKEDEKKEVEELKEYM
ncbi:hypothetical protein BJV82DRAFT_343941 [Fennellomyces sp. T-0311]|nr:hypothetical protein BJV82DRAFT_343941 [Fennellomyces sp. T-0311]